MVQQSDQSSAFRDLWSAFSRSGNQAEYCQGWLHLQCARIPHATRGVLLLRTGQEGSGSYSLAGCWPKAGAATSDIIALVDRAIEEKCGLVSELDSDDAQHALYGVAYPLKIDQDIAGVVSVVIEAQEQHALAYAMEQLQWGISWIELMVKRHQQGILKSELPRLKSAVEIVTSLLAEEHFDAASITFVTELASVLECEQVSLGLMQRGKIKIKALSNSAEFGKQMNLIKMLEAAMEEAVFQRTDICLPADPDSTLILHDHNRLAGKHSCGTIYTLPLFHDGRYLGAVTLERASDQPFSEKELETVRSISALCSEVLLLQQKNDCPYIQRSGEFLYAQLSRLFGAGYLGRKLVLVVMVLVALFFSVATDTYRVAADVRLEGSIRQVVVAPFDGYIDSAEIRAGDEVEKGQLLSRLDDQDLSLERLNWVGEGAKLERQYEEALAKRDRGLAKVLTAQLAQSRAKLNLVERRLERTELRAPFAGIVVSGDLSQRIGSAVSKGEVLFEVAPLDSYTVIMWVDEHQILDIQEGLSGYMVLKALPDDRFKFSITKITPITEVREGGNYFRVESILNSGSKRLRPGMEGVGKVEIGERNLFMILTQKLFRWIKLKAWAWMP